HPIDDDRHRFVPRDALEAAFALRSRAEAGVEHAVGAVNPLAEFPDLRADESAGDRVLLRSVDFDDLSVPDRDVQRAGIRTVERTRRLDHGRGTAQRAVTGQLGAFRQWRHVRTIAFLRCNAAFSAADDDAHPRT